MDTTMRLHQRQNLIRGGSHHDNAPLGKEGMYLTLLCTAPSDQAGAEELLLMHSTKREVGCRGKVSDTVMRCCTTRPGRQAQWEGESLS